MRFSYLCFAVAFVILIAAQVYHDGYIAAGVFAAVGVVLYIFERRKLARRKP